MVQKSLLHQWHLTNKRVFVRFDGNVPLDKDASVTSHFRLEAFLPTLKLLTQQKATITLATHLGRPKGVDPHLSTTSLRPWFEQHGFIVSTVTSPEEITEENKGVTLLENLRFDPREKKGDQCYAHLLKDHHEYYLNDGWGVMHRAETSITLLPQLFAPDHRTFGLLVEKELEQLSKLTHSPKRPYVILLGGGKTETKIPLLRALINQGAVSTIVLLPGIVFTFLKALGRPVGLSLVDETLIPVCLQLMKLASDKGIEVVFPEDFLVGEEGWSGTLNEYDREKIPPTGVGISIGSRSLNQLANLVNGAATIVYNGAMGKADLPTTSKPFITLLKLIAQSKGTTLLVGGDTIALAEQEQLVPFYTFCSTGGGSTIAYLAGEELPGLKPLLN